MAGITKCLLQQDPDNIRYNLVINSKKVPEAVAIALLKHSFSSYEVAVLF